MKPMIFFNIGWMRSYEGLDNANDKIVGGGAYVREHGYGHEILNFKPYSGYMYGFVQAKGGINIQRLGGSEGDSEINDVLVIWVARHPKGGAYIVGWYDKATVYHTLQTPPQDSKRIHNTEQIRYYVKAQEENCKRLLLDQRTFAIPRGQKGVMGQSNVWYADKASGLKNKVLDYVTKGGLPTRSTKKNLSAFHGRQPDPFKRKKIEQKAIETVVTCYQKLGYIVSSVEKDNVGWDLNATFGDRVLKLEVKGLSGNAIAVELTPNEYAKMKEFQNDFRICVVSSALTRKPSLTIFAFSHEDNNWEDDDGNKLEIVESVSAKLRLM